MQLATDVCVCECVDSALVEVHKQVLQERDDCYSASEMLRRSATPRYACPHCYELQ